MSSLRKHKLLVEGKQDKRVIPYLLDAHVVWGKDEKKWPTEIIPYDGVDDLLADDEIQTQLKTSGLEALGVIVDANDSLEKRWQRIRGLCSSAFPAIPEELPAEGLIASNDDGMRLGVWIMPDNRTFGMLETFLSYLIPDSGEKIWVLTEAHVDKAKELGAPFKEVHLAKAKIHSWLAVQDPPGESLHLAVLKKILDPTAAPCDAFVDWFVKLYKLVRR